jgi:hypothetical protein
MCIPFGRSQNVTENTFYLVLEFDIKFNPDTNTDEVKHGPSEVSLEYI